MVVGSYKNGLETSISHLVRKVYDEFVAPDYSEQGNQFFYDWIEPSRIAERQAKERTMLVAMDDSEPLGVIEIRNNDHISLLFVDKAYQGKGIARSLFREALKGCLAKNPNLRKFYVHASPFSIPVYEKLGFKSSGNLKEENGIRYLPMEMDL